MTTGALQKHQSKIIYRCNEISPAALHSLDCAQVCSKPLHKHQLTLSYQWHLTMLYPKKADNNATLVVHSKEVILYIQKKRKEKKSKH